MRGTFLFFLGGRLREEIRGSGEGEAQTEYERESSDGKRGGAFSISGVC